MENSTANSEESGYKVGPGNPPKEYQFKPGQSGNPSGRPKNTLKDYIRKKLSTMTDEEKEKWLKENGINGIDQWKMAEGNPQNETDITSQGEKINPLLVKFLDGKPNNRTNDNGDTTGVQETV